MPARQPTLANCTTVHQYVHYNYAISIITANKHHWGFQITKSSKTVAFGDRAARVGLKTGNVIQKSSVFEIFLLEVGID